MGRDRYQLELRGFLDLPAARRLLERLTELVGDRIENVELECTELEGWTFEALVLIDRGLRQSGSLPPAFRIEFTNSPSDLTLQGQLLGWSAVRGHAVIEVRDGEREHVRTNTLHCPRCENRIDFPGPGNHSCPHCHVRFFISGEHPPTFYESFGHEGVEEN